MLQKTSLTQMLYLADNMAYFPYQVQDEPLFIIHHIDIMISVTGTNLLQSFREVSNADKIVNHSFNALKLVMYKTLFVINYNLPSKVSTLILYLKVTIVPGRNHV